MNAKLRTMLALHEGRKAHAYKDTLGFLTIGVGHLVDARKGGKLPEHLIDALLDHDIETHTAGLYKELPWIVGIDEVRRCVLIDMAFNLGVAGLLKFKNTLELVKAGLYDQAALEMTKSAWASQVKTRADRLSHMMRTGVWPRELA
jgi:lysozyme